MCDRKRKKGERQQSRPSKKTNRTKRTKRNNKDISQTPLALGFLVSKALSFLKYNMCHVLRELKFRTQ